MTNADRDGDWVTGTAPPGGAPAGRTPGEHATAPASGAPEQRADDTEDAYWQRPSPDTPPLSPPAVQTAPAGEPARYGGPPRSAPPPASWRPPVVVPTMQPRAMPEQDHDRLDAEERAARTNSHGIGLVAAAVIVILVFVLCARVVG